MPMCDYSTRLEEMTMPEIRFKIGEEDHRALSERASSLEMKPSTYARSLMLRMLRKEIGAAGPATMDAASCGGK